MCLYVPGGFGGMAGTGVGTDQGFYCSVPGATTLVGVLEPEPIMGWDLFGGVLRTVVLLGGLRLELGKGWGRAGVVSGGQLERQVLFQSATSVPLLSH